MTEKSQLGSSEDCSRFAALQNGRRDLRKQSWEHQRVDDMKNLIGVFLAQLGRTATPRDSPVFSKEVFCKL